MFKKKLNPNDKILERKSRGRHHNRDIVLVLCSAHFFLPRNINDKALSLVKLIFTTSFYLADSWQALFVITQQPPFHRSTTAAPHFHFRLLFNVTYYKWAKLRKITVHPQQPENNETFIIIIILSINKNRRRPWRTMTPLRELIKSRH